MEEPCCSIKVTGTMADDRSELTRVDDGSETTEDEGSADSASDKYPNLLLNEESEDSLISP